MRKPWLLLCALLAGLSCGPGEPRSFEVVVLGGTPAGVAAAVAAAREGRTVCLVSEDGRLSGGMSVGLAEDGDPRLTGGIAREVLENIAAHYRDSYGEGSPQFRLCRDGRRFEPRVAERVLEELATSAGVTLRRGRRLAGLVSGNNRIAALCLADSSGAARDTIRGGMFIDAGGGGDLLAEAGAPFALGREGRETYGEPHAGQIFQDPATGALLPAGDGRGDSLIQAWACRPCLTDSAANSLPLPEPERYDPERYAPLREYIRVRRASRLEDFVELIPLPNRKFATANHDGCWVSLDLIGGSRDWPEAEAPQRRELERAHREHVLGLFHFLRTDPAVPEGVRQELARYGLARDELDSGLPPLPLEIREARRLHGRTVFTERDALADSLEADAIGLADRPPSSHGVGGWDYALPRPEGWLLLAPPQPYQLPYSILLPAWNRNLLVASCVSASHVAWGALRPEPVRMILGQAAGVAAALCLELNCEVDEVPVPILQQRLRAAGAVLDPAGPMPI